MNQEKFALFSEAYRAGLQTAVTKEPEKYLTRGASPEEYAAIVSARVLALIASGKHLGINYVGGGFMRACKTLGIKYTRKAILSYLEIQ